MQVLELKNAVRIRRGDFVAILEMISDSSASDFALRKIELSGYPFSISGSNPFQIEGDDDVPDQHQQHPFDLEMMMDW